MYSNLNNIYKTLRVVWQYMCIVVPEKILTSVFLTSLTLEISRESYGHAPQ